MKSNHLSTLRGYAVPRLIVVIAAFLAVGCGAQGAREGTAKSRSEILRGLALSNISEDDAEWRCPPDSDVKLAGYIAPNGGFDYSGKYDYQVCVSRNDVRRFKIVPKSNSPYLLAKKTVCVYPFKKGESMDIGLTETPKCVKVNSTMTVEFVSNSIGFMAIVDIDYSDALNSCLSGPSACPSHSEGSVQ